MENIKKIGIFIILFAAIIGAGCSIGWLIYLHQWVPFIGACVVTALAVPTWINLLKKVINE